MLLVIEDERTQQIIVAEIADCSYDTIGKTLEAIGRPELYFTEYYDFGDAEVGRTYSLYDRDEIATVMTENQIEDIDDVDFDADIEPIGGFEIADAKYIVVNGEID